MVDTSAFLALANPRDPHHSPVRDCLGAMAERRLHLFVSIPTIYESYKRFLFDLGHRQAMSFFDRLWSGSQVKLVSPQATDESDARALISKHEHLGLTLTDAANMVIMLRLKIGVAFSLDRHFLQVGFIRVPPFERGLI